MKLLVITIGLFMSTFVCAQTPETKFLKKSDVTWAAYNSDTVRFSAPNLSLLIRQQANVGKIKVAVPNIDKHNYIDKQVPLPELSNSELLSTKTFGEENNSLLYAEQFLYFNKKQLRSHVSWVSPAKKIFTLQGVYLGNSYIFNAFHNTSGTIRKSTRRKAISLGTTSIILTDSSLNGEMIKQWFGETFAVALFHTLSSDDIEIYTIDPMKKINYSELDSVRLDDYRLETPKYNIFGELMGGGFQDHRLDPKDFTKASILQQWFYDPKKQIVFNDVKEIVLFAKKIKDGQPEANPSPVLRIVYK
jgi:hypothetical protein